MTTSNGYPADQWSNGAPDPLTIIRQVVNQALTVVPSSEGAVVELVDGDELSYVCAAGSLADATGVRVPIAGSLSGSALQARETLISSDGASEERVAPSLSLRVGAASMLCVPLYRSDEPLGVLKLASSRRHAFEAEDANIMSALAGFISEAVSSWAQLVRTSRQILELEQEEDPHTLGLPGSEHSSRAERMSQFVAGVLRQGSSTEWRAKRGRIEDLLDAGQPRMVFQPIVDLCSGLLVGCEALARFDTAHARPPDEWFAEAEDVGLGEQLQVAAIGNALRQLPELPRDVYLAVNAGPRLIESPRLHDALSIVEHSRVVIELTEHEHVEDYESLAGSVQSLRAGGVRVAIDDTGAGFAGFMRILTLAPDLIKLDRVLTRGIDADPARQALAGALVSFAAATDAKVIAEGIETSAELDAVRRLGIAFGQGYFLGRPAPAAGIAALANALVEGAGPR